MFDTLRQALRRRFLAKSIQRSVPLEAEDRDTPKRKRKHVLVDLIHEQCGPERLVVVEVGVKSGGTSRHVLKYCPQIEVLYGIDIAPPPPGKDRLSRSERMQFVLGTSSAVAATFEDDSVDLAFLDADHSEASVLEDLAAWVPKVKPGGVICGHDYGAPHHPGVERAVTSWFTGHPHPIRLEANKVWWTLKAGRGA